MRVVVRQLKKLSIEDGVLKRQTTNFNQIVLPSKYRQLVFEELHGNLGHLGADRVLELARKGFYWPRMKQTIEHYVTKQCRCMIARKPNVPDKAPLSSITSTFKTSKPIGTKLQLTHSDTSPSSALHGIRSILMLCCETAKYVGQHLWHAIAHISYNCCCCHPWIEQSQLGVRPTAPVLCVAQTAAPFP